MIDDLRNTLGWPQAKPLDDYLFHAFMRIARDLEMPVQIHTGHMAGTRNDIAKTNAVRLTNTLEMHRQVQFDLFHANWPYAGDFLYLGKNFPNVALNFCWTHIIDPVYSQDVLSQALTSVPHGKIFGFGGDYGGVEYAAGHLEIARDNIAWALSRHIDSGWLDLDEARAVTADWLFNNPNRFWKLGFEPA
jgi:predicted TIM-barrel fold metal-dependent hydrolase